MGSRLGWWAAGAVAATGLLGVPDRALAGDVTAFATLPSPSEAWSRGFGAALTTTFFGISALEFEAARVPLETDAGTMTSFTVNALVQVPIAALVPYFGVGFGVYRQSIADLDETSTVGTFVAGAKLKFGLLVVRGDYRRLNLHGDPLLPMDSRVTFGAGISF
jgi:hypothetical protein